MLGSFPTVLIAHRSFVPRGFNVFTLTEVGLLFEFRFLTGNTCHIEKVCFEQDHYFTAEEEMIDQISLMLH